MADIYSLDEYRSRYVTLELRENPSLAEVIGPLYPVPEEDDPDDAA